MGFLDAEAADGGDGIDRGFGVWPSEDDGAEGCDHEEEDRDDWHAKGFGDAHGRWNVLVWGHLGKFAAGWGGVIVSSTNEGICGRLVGMRTRLLMIWLGGLLMVTGQETAPKATEAPAVTPPDPAAQVRKALEDPNGDLTNLAQAMLGEKGGNRLFYFPTRDVPATPEKWGMKFEDCEFASADGTKLHGWFLPAKGEKAKATVVFSHGNAGSIGHHLGFVMWFVEAGYHVMMYDYRGFGKSGGVVDRRGMLDDVKAAFAYVSKRKDVDASRLISYGHSLGGAKSVTALAETPVKGVCAVVIDGAFASYQTMARVMAGNLGANLVTDELSPKDFVAKLAPVPLLVVHGTADEVVPFSQGKQLFDTANEPKTLFDVKDARHGDALSRANGEYRKKMIAWLDGVLKG